jgi:hypothetical protein
MLVEKCKRVMMEERRGRSRARRMAREVASFTQNPIGSAGHFAGTAVNTMAGEDMSGGAKVLLLLVAAGVVGGGIYYLTTKPAAAATAATPVVNPNTGATSGLTLNSPVTVGGQQGTYAGLLALAASLSNTTVAAWQASGIPTAVYNNMAAQVQQAVQLAGIKVV